MKKMNTPWLEKSPIFILILFILALIASCNYGLNKEHPQITKGNKLYKKYCLECHGKSGAGIAALREHYDKIDLTLINQRRNIDEFPVDEIARYIDGRSHYKEFGPREMPMWGVDLMEKESHFNPDSARTNLGALISYLISIQED